MRGQVAFITALLISATLSAQNHTETKSPQGSVETKIKGKLIDARRDTEPKCRVAADTKEYGIIIPDGTFLVFDEGGNQNRQRDPNRQHIQSGIHHNVQIKDGSGLIN